MGKLALVLLLTSFAHAELRRDEAATLVLNGDGWTLLDQRLINRQLFLQMEQPGQSHRLWDPGRVALAADVQVSTQVPRHGTTLGKWHGFALIDTFVALQVVEGAEVTANLTAYNMGASYGYRNLAGVFPGISVHVHGFAGPIRADLLAIDLGQVTVGRGLAFEQLPLEGVLGRLKWGEVWLRHYIGGQLHSSQDDLFVTSLGWRGWTANWMVWDQDQFQGLPNYFTLAGDVLEWDDLRWAVEGGYRFANRDGDGALAAMTRADWMPSWGAAEFHLGYQARWYQQGWGPWGDDLFGGVWRPTFVWSEDTYVTNPFEALWPSAVYDQYWHTIMFEGLVPLGTERLFARAELEAQWQLFHDPGPGVRKLEARRPFRDRHVYPDPVERFWYRAGLEARLFRRSPHRGRLWVINKVASAGDSPRGASPHRLEQRGWIIALELELFL